MLTLYQLQFLPQLMVWEAYNSVYRLMVQNLSVIPGVALGPSPQCAIYSWDVTKPSEQYYCFVFQHMGCSLPWTVASWIVAIELLRKKYKWWFSKSRPYSANVFKVAYWQYPCVDECVKTNSFTGVHFKSCPSRIWLNGLSDSLSAPCLSLHSLSLGQLRFLLQARVYPHVQFLDWILLPSFTGEISKP